MSGLEYNKEKTCIMLINCDNELEASIAELGVPIVRKFKVLGLVLDSDLRCLTTVHDTTVSKITKAADFWRRFQLSLPGRINITKTFLLSQIGYLGSIITPTGEQLIKNKTNNCSLCQRQSPNCSGQSLRKNQERRSRHTGTGGLHYRPTM